MAMAAMAPNRSRIHPTVASGSLSGAAHDNGPARTKQGPAGSSRNGNPAPKRTGRRGLDSELRISEAR
eukprot:15462912-Alexandrium_andersonii.AAC.1